jgi:hypothetical protein
MDLRRLLLAASTAAAVGASSIAPTLAQSRAPDGNQSPSDLELRFKEGVQEVGEGAQKIAAAVEAGAQDFWAAGKAAFEAGAQTWQARRDARQRAAPASPEREPQR